MDETLTNVAFTAVFQSARTTIDGGWRITLDVSADNAKAVTDLATLKNTRLQVAIIPIREDE